MKAVPVSAAELGLLCTPGPSTSTAPPAVPAFDIIVRILEGLVACKEPTWP